MQKCKSLENEWSKAFIYKIKSCEENGLKNNQLYSTNNFIITNNNKKSNQSIVVKSERNCLYNNLLQTNVL